MTGMGAVTALGTGVPAFWEGLLAGRSGIAPLASLEGADLGFRNGAEAGDFRYEDPLPGRREDLIDRVGQFALVAAREAVRDAAPPWEDPALRRRTAVLAGCGAGGILTQDAAFARLYREGRHLVNPFTIPKVMGSAPAAWIAMEHKLKGPSLTFSTACSAATHAIGHAFRMVRSGEAEYAVAGGAEAPFSLGNLKAWDALRVVAPDTCRPFSRERRGLILGEGAAFLVLEALDSARARGARVHAEIAGFGMSTDAHHITHPLAEGAVDAMRDALEDAGLGPGDIGCVNAHGTGTLVNDRIESQALWEVFGSRILEIPVTSTKAAHGHALGATGAMEAVATALSISGKRVPPTAHFGTPDPECHVRVVSGRAAGWDGKAALSNTFAFGGTNAVLVFRAADA